MKTKPILLAMLVVLSACSPLAVLSKEAKLRQDAIGHMNGYVVKCDDFYFLAYSYIGLMSTNVVGSGKLRYDPSQYMLWQAKEIRIDPGAGYRPLTEADKLNGETGDGWYGNDAQITLFAARQISVYKGAPVDTTRWLDSISLSAGVYLRKGQWSNLVRDFGNPMEIDFSIDRPKSLLFTNCAVAQKLAS